MTELPAANSGQTRPSATLYRKAATAELRAQQRRAEAERFRAQLTDMNATAREDAMDQQPPATVRAYRDVYGRDPRGWPPA